MKKYDPELLQRKHPTSRKHAPMSRHNRAAQFAPFRALTGFEGVIDETIRLTRERIAQDERGLDLSELSIP